MLKQISIEGYKSIRSMSLELRPLNVLIGANGAGKSNFLSFFGLLKSVVDKKFQLHVGHVGGAESILFGGVKRTQEIKASMVLEDADTERTYKLKWMFSMPDSLRFARETVLFAKETVSYPDETKNAYCIDMLDSHGPDARFESGIRDRAARGDEHAARFQHLFGTSYVYHFADTSYSAAFQHQCYIHDNRRLAPDGRNLAAMLYRYRHTAPERYERLLWTIKQVAPWFDDFSVEPLALNPENVMLNWRHVGFDMEFGPHQLPGGGFRAFALVTLLLQPIEDLPDLLLIDEPELGLHPEAVAIVASLIHQVSHYTQVLVATQSTGLLDHFEPEDVVVVDLKDNASVFRHLEREELAEWVDDFALSELWEKNYLGGGPGA
ncbi:MAG: AAA family ATPase [Planctomycetaceae bacterium]|nr:AAA family ATPase [Planctomycetaceae bacterium]